MIQGGTVPLLGAGEPGRPASSDVVKRAAHRRGGRSGRRRHPFGQLAQLGEHPLHHTTGRRVTSIEITCIFTADLDQAALMPLK